TILVDVILGNNGLVQEEIKISNIVDGDLTLVKNYAEKGNFVFESLDLLKECTKLQAFENIEPTTLRREKRGPPPGWRFFNPISSPRPFESKLFTALKQFLSVWYWFQPTRQITPRMAPGEERRLDSSGANLVKYLNSILSESPTRYVSLINDVLHILPSLSEILSPLRGNEAVVQVKERELETPTDISNLSHGVMQTLVLVIGVVTSEPGSIVLIEEPELHLHAASQRKLFELIQREAKTKQFFITTHSSIFTGCSEKINTFLVTKKVGATNVSRIKEPSELKRIKNELGHRNTDLFGYECVIFIEGDSEQSALPIIADAMGHDLVEIGIHLTNIRGKGKVSKIGEFLTYLKDSDVAPYVIADGDKQVRERLVDWVRQGLLQKDFQTVWVLEFEDCFTLDMIVEAMKEVAKEQGFEFEITAKDLKENIPKGKSVVKVLEKLLHQKDLPSLNKPALSETLALILKEEIEKGGTYREKTPPELAIEKIVGLVEARRTT
ncbi:MAG: AAA family ATPase, partial [Promethearchaeota archaeon]